MVNFLKGFVGFLVMLAIIITILTAGLKWGADLGLDKFGDGLLKYVFVGSDEVYNNINTSSAQNIGYLVTALMVWLIIFVGFGDIIENFSAFSSGIGWIIAFAVGVIAANAKFINSIIITLTKWFAIFGTAAIYVGLFLSIAAFVLLNLGVPKISAYIRERNALNKEAIGEAHLAAGIRGVGRAGQELENLGGK
jgi:hypothetical protein